MKRLLRVYHLLLPKRKGIKATTTCRRRGRGALFTAIGHRTGIDKRIHGITKSTLLHGPITVLRLCLARRLLLRLRGLLLLLLLQLKLTTILGSALRREEKESDSL